MKNSTMKIVSVWNPKGGQGKSTISINIAGAAVNIGLKVLLIDNDMQGTSMLFYKGGKLPFEVISKIPDKAPDVDLVIIDHMASDYDIPEPKQLVMPFLPVRSQYAAYIKNFKKAEKAKKNIISIVTGGDLRKRMQRDTVHDVRKQGVFEIKRSGVFDEADAEYKTIFDSQFDKYYNVNATRTQVASVLTAILREI